MASPSAEQSDTPFDDRYIDGIPDQLIHRPRRLLPALTIAFILGIISGIYASSPFMIPMLLAAISVFTAVWFRDTRAGSVCILLAVLFTSWALVVLRCGESAGERLGPYMMRSPAHAEIRTQVMSHPQVMAPDARGRSIVQFDGRVESIRHHDGYVPVKACVVVRLIGNDADVPAVRYGDRLNIRGTLRLDERPQTKARGIAGYMSAQRDNMLVLETGAGIPLVAWCYQMRESAQQRLGWGVDENSPSVSLTRALLLGYRQDVPLRVYEAFARTGTLHILALSGMHVGIIVLLLVIFLKALGISRMYWICFFLPFLTAYTIGTGAPASMVRAVIMAVVFFSSYLVRRRADTPSSLALAALLILTVDPLQLFDYGFILSFVAVGGIVMLYPAMIDCVRRTAASRDEWADPETGWFAASAPWRSRLGELAGISAAAWLVTLPLIATVFHLISPIALIVNIALVPLSSVILLTACLSMGAGFVSYGLASLFNHANVMFGELLLYMVERTSAVPGSHVYVAAWPWYLVAGWYVLLVMWIAGRGKIRIAVSFCLVIMMAWSMGQRTWSRAVHAVSIPNGDVCLLLIDGPGNHAMLIDGGSAYRQRELIEKLRQRGISGIDRLVLTRATSDSYSGIAGLMQSMNVGEVLTPPLKYKQLAYEEHRRIWETLIGTEKILEWTAGQEIYGPDGLLIRFLYPPKNHSYENSRVSSLILHISRGVNSVLFMGLADPSIEQKAGDLSLDWNADHLVVGRCGDLDGLSSRWLTLVSPRTVQISSRPFDRLPHGPYRIKERIQAMDGVSWYDVSDEELVEFNL